MLRWPLSASNRTLFARTGITRYDRALQFRPPHDSGNLFIDAPLADFPVFVNSGGILIHFLSDSQWVLHWLLYCGPEWLRSPGRDRQRTRV